MKEKHIDSGWEMGMKDAADDHEETEEIEPSNEEKTSQEAPEDQAQSKSTIDHPKHNKPVIDLSLNEWRQRMVITAEQEQLLADVKLVNRIGLNDKFAEFLEHELKQAYGIAKEELQERLQKKKNEIEAQFEIYGRHWTQAEEEFLKLEQEKLIESLIGENKIGKIGEIEAAQGAAAAHAAKLFNALTADYELDGIQARYADAFDRIGAEKYMKEAAFLGWMMFYRGLSKKMREYSFHCCCYNLTPLKIATVIYFLVAFYTYPVSWLIINYFERDDPTVFLPAGEWIETAQEWELTDILLFFVQSCLIIAFTILVNFFAHISSLEINGSLYNKHIEVFRPFVDKAKRRSTYVGDKKNRDTENPEEVNQEVPKKPMIWESFWIKQDTNGEIERLLNASRRRHRWFFLFGYIGIGVFFIIGGFIYSYSNLVQINGYFILDLIMKISVAVIASLNGMATVIIIADFTALMTAHFSGFEENLNLICLRALTQKKKDNGKVDKNEEILKGLIENLREYEDYLMTVGAASREVFDAGLNNLFFAIASIYFFMLFYLYASFLRMIKQGYQSGKDFTVLGCLVGTVVMTSPVAYPLYRMTEQSQAWKEFTDRLGASLYIDAARLLSDDDKEPMYFQAKFRKLQDHFTWKILGYPLSYAVITGAFTSYLAVLWASIIYPAIQEYANDQLDKFEDAINKVQDAAQDAVENLVGDL